MENKILVTIISYNNLESIRRAILEIQNFDKVDLLIIDDGSDYDIIDEIKEFKFVKCISHDDFSGYGTCLATAIIFARDLHYHYLITLNPEDTGFTRDLPNIINNLDYGFDIITCSRILENPDYNKINEDVLKFYEKLTDCLKDVTEIDITDSLSPNKGFNINNINDLELTDDGHGALLQLFVQCAYFGYNIMEIPTESASSLGNELSLYTDPLETFFIIIETEKYLYNKGSIN